MRRAARTDSVQTSIIAALRKIGCTVEILGRPVDLAVRRDCWPDGVFMLMEAKSARKKRSGAVKLDPRQTTQGAFCATHGIPYVCSPSEAIAALPLL